MFNFSSAVTYFHIKTNSKLTDKQRTTLLNIKKYYIVNIDTNNVKPRKGLFEDPNPKDLLSVT